MNINEECLVSVNNCEWVWCVPLFLGEVTVVLRMRHHPEAAYHACDVEFKPLENKPISIDQIKSELTTGTVSLENYLRHNFDIYRKTK